MKQQKEKAIIQQYMDGWKHGSQSEILDALSEDCIIIESHGPVYRGKESVKKWIEDWLGRGNVVEKWTITSFYSCDGIIVCQWIFAYQGKVREAFEGVSLVTLKDGKISDLREYRMTAFPYIWQPNR